MLRFYIILTLTCVFHAKANPIDNLLSLINAELPKILENHDEFSNSIIRSVYALRDSTSDIIFSGPWNATLTLSNILSEAAKTLNQKECIARRQLEWKAKVPSINSDLYKCVYDIIKMGDEIRKNIQNAYEVRSDSLTDFNKTVNEAIKTILNYEEEFSNSVILMLSNLKDLSMEVNSKALQAILDQANFFNEKVAKIDQTVCIDSTKDKFGEKIVKLSFDLDTCVHVPKKIGDSIREKFQASHQETLKMAEDVKEFKTSCSIKTEKPEEECISQKISKTKKKLNILLDEAKMLNIAGETLKPKILSESLKCSVKVSTEMFEIANEFQTLFKNCIA